MRRRVIAAALAAVLTIVGAVFLVQYVNTADKRAQANLKPVDVLVVVTAIPKGTPAEQLGEAVELRSLPQGAVASGAANDVAQLAGRVAASDLQPGEQVLVTKFVSAASLNYDTVPVPKGMQEVSIVLNAVRVIGGVVRPGNTVGVFITITPGAGATTPPFTNVMLNKILVTRVQGATAIEGAAASPSAQPTMAAAGQSVMVTLALNAADAAKVIYAAEKASIWLTLQNGDTNPAGQRAINEGNLFS